MIAAAVSISSLLLVGAATAETRMGVLPMTVAGIAQDGTLSQTLTTALVAEIRRNAPAAEVFGPDDVRALLGAVHAAACADVSCFGLMAAGAGVDELVLANLVSFGHGDLLTLTLLDAHRNVILATVEDRQAEPMNAGAAGRSRHSSSRDPLDRLALAVARLLAPGQPPRAAQLRFERLEVLLDPWPRQ